MDFYVISAASGQNMQVKNDARTASGAFFLWGGSYQVLRFRPVAACSACTLPSPDFFIFLFIF